MNEFRKRLLRNNSEANLLLWKKAHRVYDQRTLAEEWDLTTDGHPRLEAQFDSDQWSAILAKQGKCDG